MLLSTSIDDSGKLFANYAKRLENLDIKVLRDFLYHLPHRYDDFSLITPIEKIQAGEVVTIQVTIASIKNNFTKNHKQIQKAVVTDGTGEIEIIWFNQPFITKTLRSGEHVAFSGRVETDGFKLLMTNPDFEVIPANGQTIHTGRLVPIYPETHGVSSKWLRRQTYKLLSTNEFEEFLPPSLVDQLGLMSYRDALYKIHFPDTLAEAEKARERLSFDEVFLLQLAAMKRKTEWKQTLKGHIFQLNPYEKQIDAFWESLPFEPTNAQKRVIHEIFLDFSKGEVMNRLLEGDVGSGKTVVAAIAMYISFLNGFQSVLMAPTQILAEQHYQTIFKLLQPLGVRVGLQTGNKKINNAAIPNGGEESHPTQNQSLSRDPSTTLRSAQDDKLPFHILVGTHAVLSDKVNFDKLGLVVIDEQHRFGVAQRTLIQEKGINPHVLTMTATPIPRTVALTLYGDLDLSVLDEMPKGRKIIKTWFVPAQKRDGAYLWIGEKVKEGDQVFIVCPFIEESESMTTVKAASVEFERLQKHIFPNLKLGLLHGKQKASEKEQVLQAFRDKRIDILVATPVVEVGIDIPNATIIVIEAADRFGLAQLHQLRGRVGRGTKQSYCLLFTESKSLETTHRLKSLEHIHNGAELSELDLKMRGAGELYGTLQHGRRWLKIASFGDFRLIELAKQQAGKIFSQLKDHHALEAKVEEITLKQVSPN
ncbi:MAG TPA: ATP-dependent DNA helicase RecG [Candidatus Saccharimonadales bacterium]|nr:ATP-dependent DNA helicase RecG [Candidatus Saccharimonadales bacterium]